MTETRCPATKSGEHDWLENQLCEAHCWPYYVCRHSGCDAVGQECPRCKGGDFVGAPDRESCLRCSADGIVPATMFRVAVGDAWTLVAAANPDQAREFAGLALDVPDLDGLAIAAVEPIGRCEGCLRLVYECEQREATDRDEDGLGDGILCPDCAEEGN